MDGRVAYHLHVAKRIGELLVEAGVLSQQQLEQALFAQRKDGRKLGQLLIELGFASEEQLTQTLSRQLSVPWVSLYHVDFSRSLLNLVPHAVAEKYSLVPIFVRRVRNQGDTLYVAMEDPTNDAALDEVTKASSLPVKPMIACPSDIRAAIRVYYLGESASAPPAAPSVAVVAQPIAKPAVPPVQASKQVRSPPANVAPVAAAPPVPTAQAAPTGPAEPQRKRAASVPDSAPQRSRADSVSDWSGQDQEPGTGRKFRPKMLSLTLLDGTTISVPAPKKRGSMPDIEAPPGEELSDQLTARDLISALRAVAHGADASEILGTEPRWEALFSTLLSILLRKGLIADWEFIEEFRKI
jgi:type IV pilus assembly protein PilB